jgi:hypothetical protein
VSSVDQKLDLLAAAGVDATLVLRFDEALASSIRVPSSSTCSSAWEWST